MKLEIESVPELNWGHNLAHLLPAPQWDRLRRETYRKSGFKCQICKARGRLNCHEVWEYDDKKRIQYLDKLQSLCDMCHDIKHWGRTVLMVHKGQYRPEYLEELTKHFCKVNNCSEVHFLEEKMRAGELQQERNRRRYQVRFGAYSILVK